MKITTDSNLEVVVNLHFVDIRNINNKTCFHMDAQENCELTGIKRVVELRDILNLIISRHYGVEK